MPTIEKDRLSSERAEFTKILASFSKSPFLLHPMNSLDRHISGNGRGSAIELTISDEERESLRLEHLSTEFPERFGLSLLEEMYKDQKRLFPRGKEILTRLRFVYAMRVGMAERIRLSDSNIKPDSAFRADLEDLTDVVDGFDDAFFNIYSEEIRFINSNVPILEKKKPRTW